MLVGIDGLQSSESGGDKVKRERRRMEGAMQELKKPGFALGRV